jgi:hypothetical protein
LPLYKLSEAMQVPAGRDGARHSGLGATAAPSRLWALAKHHDRAEAALIALYAARRAGAISHSFHYRP